LLEPSVYNEDVLTRRYKRVPDWFYFFGLLPFLALFPRKWAAPILRWQGKHIHDVQDFHRTLVYRNMNELLTTRLSPAERAAAARKTFDVWVWEDFEAFYFPFWKSSNIDRYFTFEGLENLDRALEQGKGALLFSGHIGSTCAAVIALALKGYPLHPLIHSSPNDPTMPAAFRSYARVKIHWMTQTSGQEPVVVALNGPAEANSMAAVDIYRILSQNHFVSVAMDVPPHLADNREEVDFLGHRCCFPVGLLKLAYLSGTPVIPYFSWRDPEDWTRQRLRVQPPIQISRNLKNDLQRCVDRLSDQIMERPEQWLSWDSFDHFRAPATVGVKNGES